MAKAKTAAPETVEKPKRKKQPAYKYVTCFGTIAGVTDAFSTIEELAGEAREIFDNMDSNNLGQTSRCQTFGETADTLENVSEVDVPECLQDDIFKFQYQEGVPTRKSRGTSRAQRLANAIEYLNAAAGAATEAADDEDNDLSDDDREEARQFASEVEDAANEAENVEFPGMFG